MIIDPGAVSAAVVAVDLGDRGLGKLISPRHAVRCRRFAISLAVTLVDLVVLRIGLVDIAPNLEIEFSLGCRSRGRLGFGVLVLLALSDDGIGRRLPGLETTRRVTDDLEVAGEWRPNM